jgi:hypothetical protein
MAATLDGIVRIMAVQDFPPSRALRFVFLLKESIRTVLAEEIDANRRQEEALEIERSIDRLALQAFDVYMSCREKIYEMKANDANRRAASLLRRANLVVNDGGPD